MSRALVPSRLQAAPEGRASLVRGKGLPRRQKRAREGTFSGWADGDAEKEGQELYPDKKFDMQEYMQDKWEDKLRKAGYESDVSIDLLYKKRDKIRAQLREAEDHLGCAYERNRIIEQRSSDQKKKRIKRILTAPVRAVASAGAALAGAVLPDSHVNIT